MKIEDIRRILVLGSGTMGQQIGLICALHGYDVVIYDIAGDLLEKALKRMKKNAERMISFNRFTREQADAAFTRITTTDNAKEAAEGADLISESVPEDPALKGKVFAQFNELCRPDTIFTTNTSSLVPSMFSEMSGRPEKLCALHFHDVAITNVVDIMPHPGTSPETLELVKKFAERIGQTAIILHKESKGYVFNNMLMAFIASALSLASNGIASIEDIDRSWMGVMHTPAGPFGIMDNIGLETAWKVTDHWARARNDKKAIANAAFLKKYIDEGKIGIKTGEGFYKYPDPAYMRQDFLAAAK